MLHTDGCEKGRVLVIAVRKATGLIRRGNRMPVCRNTREEGKMSRTAAKDHKRRFHWRMSAMIPLLLVICSLFVIIFQDIALACDCDDYSITFRESSFDGIDTTFYYDVQVCCGLLKHWVLEMPACVAASDVNDAGVAPDVSDWDWKELDGATGLRGVMLKEDVEYVMKKLDLTEKEFLAILRAKPKSFLEYPNNYTLLTKYPRLIKFAFKFIYKTPPQIFYYLEK